MNIKTKNEELDRLSLPDFKNAEKAPIYVVLDNVRSAQNVGSVFRTMDAFRCKAIFLCGITAAPPHREINKTALGSTETVAWKYFENTRDAVLELKKMNVKTFAVEQTQNSILLNEFTLDHSTPAAFIFGNEVSGVSQEIVNLAHESIEIPQYGSKHSLNIAVCAGIVIWHATMGFDYKS